MPSDKRGQCRTRLTPYLTLIVAVPRHRRRGTTVWLPATRPGPTEGPAARAAVARRGEHPVPRRPQGGAVVEAGLGQDRERA